MVLGLISCALLGASRNWPAGAMPDLGRPCPRVGLQNDKLPMKRSRQQLLNALPGGRSGMAPAGRFAELEVSYNA